MANYFEVSEGIRVAGAFPVDGDRYVAANISIRDLLYTNERIFNGLQVYVEDIETLYLCVDASIPTWTELSTTTGGTHIVSDPKQIIFNSGGTLTGHSNLTYDYDNSIFKVSDIKSEFNITTSNYSDPTLHLKSNWVDGIEIDVATNNQYGALFLTEKSKGSISSKANVTDDFLVIYDHRGFFGSSGQTGVDIQIKADNWSNDNYATEYKISTVSSGNTGTTERFLINGQGNIRFNDAYTFPKISGLTNQVLSLSADSSLYWTDSASGSLSGLSDTFINNIQEGDKLIYSGGTWINAEDVDTILTQNISSGGTFEFIIGDNTKVNAMFIHFMNYRATDVFQMGELQLLHDGTDAQTTTNGQDLDLFVTYTSRLDGDDIILICDVPTNLTSDVIMKYTIEKF